MATEFQHKFLGPAIPSSRGVFGKLSNSVIGNFLITHRPSQRLVSLWLIITLHKPLACFVLQHIVSPTKTSYISGMNYSVYVLKSLKNGWLYIGMTSKDPRSRLKNIMQGKARILIFIGRMRFSITR